MVFNECASKVLDKINREKIPDTQSSLLIEDIIDTKKSNEDKLGNIIDENCSFEVRKFKYLQSEKYSNIANKNCT